VGWRAKPTRAVGDSWRWYYRALLRYHLDGFFEPIFSREHVRRVGEMTFTLAGGAILGWSSAIYATPRVNRVDYWNPFSISLFAIVGVGFVIFLLGEHYKLKKAPNVVHNHFHYYGSQTPMPTLESESTGRHHVQLGAGNTFTVAPGAGESATVEIEVAPGQSMTIPFPASATWTEPRAEGDLSPPSPGDTSTDDPRPGQR
jgi:hypothetical protein